MAFRHSPVLLIAGEKIPTVFVLVFSSSMLIVLLLFFMTHTRCWNFPPVAPANATRFPTLCRVKVRFVVMMQCGQAATECYAAHVSTWFFSVYITSLPRVVVGNSTCRVPGWRWRIHGILLHTGTVDGPYRNYI